MMEYEICKRDSLSPETVAKMFLLMRDNYLGVVKEDFHRDLSQKDYVILLKSKNNLCGFSTFRLFNHTYREQKIRVAFSGDTIICKENRNSRILPISFGMLMNRIESDSNTPLYWMLISKGFRTYRFLPIYFQEFFPVFNRETPEYELGLMNSLGTRLFDQRFNETTGIIQSCGQSVKNIEDDRNAISRRTDSHINFFNEKNPGWTKGDELVCLVKYEQANLNPFIAKRLEVEESRLERVAQ